MILGADRGLSLCGLDCVVTIDWSGHDQADLFGNQLA